MAEAPADGPMTNGLAITAMVETTAFRLLLVALVQHGALPREQAHAVVTMAANFARKLDVTPDLRPVSAALAGLYDNMKEDHRDG